MARQAAVTFFYQSGFTVAVGKTLLIFSYWQEHVPEDLRLSDQDFRGFTNIIVFIPRASIEHNDPAIWRFGRGFPISYVAAEEVEAGDSKKSHQTVRLMRKGESIRIAGTQITAYGSTDTGVSFMVKVAGVHVFHAGDLNLWHWREHSTLREITRSEDEYYQAVTDIREERIDICMFPLDPNLGGFFDAGANHFIMAKKPRLFFPMHWGARNEIAQDYARRMHTGFTTVYALTQPRQTALIDFTVNPPAVRDSLGDRKLLGRSAKTQEPGHVNLSAYISDDPFSETDLPVDLPEPPAGSRS